MRRRNFLKMLGLTTTEMVLPGVFSACHKNSTPPNILLIVADDLGWSETTCYGHDFYETPNIARLAAEGVRFTSAYSASPVCSPTRASIMTGKYATRFGLTDWIPGENAGQKTPLQCPTTLQYLPNEEITIAEVLKASGYATCSVGKWHLGGQGHLPQDQGFDINIAGTHRGGPFGGYFLPNKMDLENTHPGEYLTDRLTQEGINFIESEKRPFFLVQSYHVPHWPIQAKKTYAAKYREKAQGWRRSDAYVANYAGMVQSLDEGVGRIMETLKKLGIADQTLVSFTSDNGGDSRFSNQSPLREGKGHLYEAGIRVPLIVRYPPLINPGSFCHFPVCSIDFYPTILEIAGITDTSEHFYDGVSLVPLLQGAQALKRQALFWHYPHYNPQGGSPSSAIRYGDEKLILFYEDHHLELYNLAHDVREMRNTVERDSEKTLMLKALLDKWLESVEAQIPIH